jgi:hypothetical protein
MMNSETESGTGKKHVFCRTIRKKKVEEARTMRKIEGKSHDTVKRVSPDDTKKRESGGIRSMNDEK